jgi:hypothetical protein
MTRVAPLLLLLMLTACSEGPPTPGTLVTFDNVCDKANEGKRVAVEGYLTFPSEFKEHDISIMMRLRPAPDGHSKNVIGASVKLGSQVEEPPVSFSQKDMKLHAADGKVLGYHDKVRVSGSMYYPSSIAHVEFECALSNTLIESAGH